PGEVGGDRGTGAVLVAAGGPRGEEVGALGRVGAEQAGQPPGEGEPAPAAQLVVLGAEVAGERGEPGLVPRTVQGLEDRPGEPLAGPRVGVGVGAEHT